METKYCSKCNSEKSLDEFYTQNDRPNGSAYCKSCCNKYSIQRWIQRKIEAIQYKGGKCVDCGLSHPENHYSIFEFHHLIPAQKEMSWTKLRLHPIEKIKQELDKCDLLCANCHRVRHATSENLD